MLINAYESAISQQSAERAKIIANETNKKPKSSDWKPITSNVEDNESNIGEHKIGDFVRATYDVDGVDYEAEIIAIDVKDESCLIRFIGYQNEQFVKMADLVDSWGTDEQVKQRIEATESQYDDEDDIEDSNVLFQKQNYSAGSANLPIPPMPPIPPMLANSLEHESEEFSAMLMAWYMSGYYTGFYQGRQLARKAQLKAAVKHNKTKNLTLNTK